MEFNKITYYDLRLEALKGRLLNIVGRQEEISRISRVVERSIHNNCLVAGPSGCGKSSLLLGWANYHLKHFGQKNTAIVQLQGESFASLGSAAPAVLQKYKEALASLPPCTLIIDNFGQLVYNNQATLNYMITLLKSLAENEKIHLLLSMESKELKWLETEQPNFLNFFEILNIKPQIPEEQVQILRHALKKLDKPGQQKIETGALELILQLAEKFPSLGRLPASGISLLDEALAMAKFTKASMLSENEIYRVVSDKTGVPLSQLKASEKQLLKNLENELNSRIVGQAPALRQITSVITRAKLGLKNPGRPLGSFLVLGPSGVGKTETAKLVAEKIFGKKESFTRIDMSEFGEAHMVSRLIGAPAGYVGFDSGGGLTAAVKQEPYSLVLLDEIEKAHPKIFDIFLQILDDGRLTSGQGETVDFTQTIVMATSNAAVEEILKGFKENADIHSEEFYQTCIVPALTKNFRLEFLNRFDAVLVFKPLTQNDLMDIALLEIEKIQSRVAKHKFKFKIDPAILQSKIQSLADPRFGARPVKRFVEATCEDLISQKLLA